MGEINQWLPIIIGLTVTGMFAGTVAGLLGVGGGIINVPVLYFLFQYLGVSASSAMVIATGTSLATIIPTSISSIRAHHQRGNIDWPLIRRWWLFIVVGVILGSWIVTLFEGIYFVFLFSLLALLMAYNFGLRTHSAALFCDLPPMPYQGFLGTLVGFFSVMVGVGGGTLGVSVLTSFNHKVHRAVGSCSVFGLLISLPGALMLLLYATTPVDAPVSTWGYVNFLALVILTPLSVVFAPIGVWLGSRLDGAKLKKIFAIFLLITASRMLVQVFSD